MDKNTQALMGHELAPPSLMASVPGASAASRNDGEDTPGILHVVGHGHRPPSKPRSRAPWVAVAGFAVAGVLGWVWWTGSSPPAGQLQVAAAPLVQDSLDMAGREPRADALTLRESEPVAHTPAVPETARIESVDTQEPASVGTLATGALPAAPSPAASAPASPSSTRSSVPSKRTAEGSVRDPAQASARVSGRRTSDPDVDVIEVLMSRTAPVAGAESRVESRSAKTSSASQDVVLVQPGVSTEELLRRCAALGGLEGQLCQARICDVRGARHASCASAAAVAGRP